MKSCLQFLFFFYKCLSILFQFSPGPSAWSADVRPARAQPASWRRPRSGACTRSFSRAGAWQSWPQTRRTAPGTRSWWHTPYHSCPEWTTWGGSLRRGPRDVAQQSLRPPGSLTPHLYLRTAAGGAAPCLAVGGLKTASCSRKEKRTQVSVMEVTGR